MKINKNSWHYKLIDWAGVDKPHNLCEYVKAKKEKYCPIIELVD